MRSGTSSRTVTAIRVVVIGYALGMTAVAMAMNMVGDSNTLGMLLMFGPRWLLVLPWLALVPLAFVASRRTALVAIVAAISTLLYVSGYEVPSRNDVIRAPANGAGGTLRLVTYNSDRSELLANRIGADLLEWNADVILIQDCSVAVRSALQAVAGRGALTANAPYVLHAESEFCVVSRLSLVGNIAVDGSRSDGRALSFTVEFQRGSVSISTVHLPSPRTALWAARNGNLAELEQSVRQRSSASRYISKWVSARRAKNPAIVAGDFNMAAESRALREDWPELRNAFSEAGWGFGHTMFAGYHRVRIDHVLVTAEWSVDAARVLAGYPSEHQPVVVDLALERR